MKIRIPSFHGLCLMAAVLLAGRGFADESAPTPPPEISIGQRAPNFTLKDQNEREVSLDALLKKGPVALVFFRSADWCLFCKMQLAQFQRNLKEIQSPDAQLIALSYDSAKTLKTFAERSKITFPLLSDPGSKIIDAYAMRSMNGNDDQVGCARHGIFIIDQKGFVRAKPVLVTYEDRLAVDALVKAIKEAHNQNGGTKL